MSTLTRARKLFQLQASKPGRVCQASWTLELEYRQSQGTHLTSCLACLYLDLTSEQSFPTPNYPPLITFTLRLIYLSSSLAPTTHNIQSDSFLILSLEKSIPSS